MPRGTSSSCDWVEHPPLGLLGIDAGTPRRASRPRLQAWDRPDEQPRARVDLGVPRRELARAPSREEARRLEVSRRQRPLAAGGGALRQAGHDAGATSSCSGPRPTRRPRCPFPITERFEQEPCSQAFDSPACRDRSLRANSELSRFLRGRQLEGSVRPHGEGRVGAARGGRRRYLAATVFWTVPQRRGPRSWAARRLDLPAGAW